jgi:F-type H+-transporting ATPase subunit delta
MTTSATVIRAKAAVYAQVLLDAAQTTGTVFEVAGQLETLLATVRGNIELRNTLGEAGIDAGTRSAIAREVFVGFDEALLATFDVMIDRGDLAALGKTNALYAQLAETALGAVIIDVHTVVALDENLRQKIITKYSAQFGTSVLLREHIDPSLVGGIVLSAHGKRIDASVSAQLESARVVLSKQ